MELHLHLDGSLSPDFIAKRAAARRIEMPAPPDRSDQSKHFWIFGRFRASSVDFWIFRLRDWLMQQKVVKLKKDGNKAAKGGNWPIFDFCNQFLQVLLLLMMMILWFG